MRDCTLESTLAARAREGTTTDETLADVATISREVPLVRRVWVFYNICDPSDEGAGD